MYTCIYKISIKIVQKGNKKEKTWREQKMNNNNFLLTINSILYSIHTGGWVEGGRRGGGVGRGKLLILVPPPLLPSGEFVEKFQD